MTAPDYPVAIRVDGILCSFETRFVTGVEVQARGQHFDNATLFLEAKGKDVLIIKEQKLELRNGMKFRTVPLALGA